MTVVADHFLKIQQDQDLPVFLLQPAEGLIQLSAAFLPEDVQFRLLRRFVRKSLVPGNKAVSSQVSQRQLLSDGEQSGSEGALS